LDDPCGRVGEEALREDEVDREAGRRRNRRNPLGATIAAPRTCVVR
jgi:hypothetical protein